MRSLQFLVMLICMSVPVYGQITGTNAPKPLPNNYRKSEVIVALKGGRSIQGRLNSSCISPIFSYIEIKENDTNEKFKLMSEDIETITVLPFRMKKTPVYSDTTVFTRVSIERKLSQGETEIIERWLRNDYRGRNVSLYSSFFGEVKYSDIPGGASAGYREFFLQKPGESVARPILIEGAGTVMAVGRAKLYAEKFEEYPEIAEKILNKEFEIRRGPYYVVTALDEYLNK